MVPRLLYTHCPGEVIDADGVDDGPLPAPCVRCGKPAAPFETTPDGPLCWRCWPPDGPAWRAAMLSRTFWRLVAARTVQEAAIACRG